MEGIFNGIQGQQQVVGYLDRVLASGNATHAYLICGPADCGKEEIALRFAAGLLAGNDAAAYDSALRQVHPDLHLVRPGGAAGYVIDQVRECVHDTELAPVQSACKVYVFFDVERFNAASANAFLKTLEEPPADVHILMLASSANAVLDTICSRCQVLTCNAVACTAEGSFEVIDLAYAAATGADSRTLLEGAKRIVELADEGVEELKESHDAESAAGSDYLSQGAKKELEQRHKREQTAQVRTSLLESIGHMRGWLRDCLLVSQGTPQLAVNTAVMQRTQQVASSATTGALLEALAATERAREHISHNVTPQLALEACLFEIREALCPR